MIQYLLSLFKTYPNRYCNLSTTGKSNNYIINNLNILKIDKSIFVFTIVWILSKLVLFQTLSLRPKELFYPTHYFGKIFMPSYPSSIVYYSVCIGTILLIISYLLYNHSLYLRLIITFALLWINLPENSYGFQCHTAHLLILYHLFSLFLPIDKIKFNKNNENISKTVEWIFIGLMTTYFFSGFWKIIGIFYKIVFKPNELNWLSSNAAISNFIVRFRAEDHTFNHILPLFSFSLFWQISFLFTTYVLTFSIFSAYRIPLRIWTGIALIFFHLVNLYIFNITFITTPFVLLFLFFPYEIWRLKTDLTPIIQKKITGYGPDAIYERIYLNGDKDTFIGYYAYREKITDNNRIIGGLLYIPFLDIAIKGYWRLTKRNKKILKLT